MMELAIVCPQTKKQTSNKAEVTMYRRVYELTPDITVVIRNEDFIRNYWGEFESIRRVIIISRLHTPGIYFLPMCFSDAFSDREILLTNEVKSAVTRFM